MIRSQSKLNIDEQKKSRNGFLNALRPRKQANNELNISSTSKLQNKPRPLSSSISSINLNQKYNEGLEIRDSYTTTVARRRTGINAKENYTDTIQSTGTANTKASSTTKTLKTRSSAPNLKRHSMLIGNPIISPVPDQIDPNFVSMLSEKTNFDCEYLKNKNSSDTLYSIDDIYDDKLSVKLFNFDEGDSDSDSDSFATLHRTTNMDDISGFMSMINPNKEKLPINNRKSLDLENLETEKLLKTLNSEETHLMSNLTLVENALFLSSTEKSQIKNIRMCPLLDSVDNEIMKSLKEESFIEQNDSIHFI